MYMVLVSGWVWGRTTHWMAMILAWRTEQRGEVSTLRSPEGYKPCKRIKGHAGTTYQE